MSVNQNQQINVFNKGMNTDTSDAYLSNEQYRYAENLRFITNTGENSGELRLIEGYKKVYKNTGNQVWFNDGEEIIAVTSIRNLIVMLTNFTVPNKGRSGNIRVIDTSKPYERKNGVVTNPRIIFQSFDFQWDPTIKYSLVTRWESGSNVKLYIADGIHELMSLNLMTKIQYTSLDQLSGEDNSNLNPIVWRESKTSGNIECPTIQYCYYLYNDNGRHSDLSPTTEIIRLYDTDQQNSIIGFDSVTNTGKAVDLEITFNDNQYQNIIIFRIEYLLNGSTPSVYIIYDEPIQGSELHYTDIGTYGMSYSFAQFLSIRQYKFIPKMIESKGDRLFAANIKDVQEDLNIMFNNVDITYELINEKQYKLDQYGMFVEGKSNYGASLMAGETYRYGFVFYTNDGRYTSVLNIKTITVPKNTQICSMRKVELNGHRPDPNEDINRMVYEFSRIGVRFTVKNLPQNCVGYEIVRCNRTSADSTTITQGILGSVFKIPQSNIRYASALMSLQKFYASDDVFTTPDLTIFASPESSYQMDDTIDAMKLYQSDINVKEIHRYNITPKLATGDFVTQWLSFNQDSNSSDVASPLRLEFNHNMLVDQTIKRVSYGWSTLHAINDNGRFLALNYLCPDSKTNGGLIGKIQNFEPVYSPNAFGFDDNGTINVENDAKIVNDLEYINWDIFPLIKNGEMQAADSTVLQNLSFDISHPNNNRNRTISSGKKGIIIKSNIDEISSSSASITSIQSGSPVFGEGVAPISVVNIEKSSSRPYGGEGPQAYQQNTFYSFGNYKQKTSSVSETVDVYDGDVFNCMFIYNSAHAWYSSHYTALMFPTVYSVPIQSRIDLIARTGDLYPDFMENQYSWWFQDVSGEYSGLVQDKDAYMYNTSYSIQTPAFAHTYSNTQGANNIFKDVRIFYSEPKTDNELIDSWTNFKALNFLDVDSRYGEITDMRLFKNSLIYWQKNAVGILSVNERTMLQDVNNTNIILGNGDVLQRFDYLSTKYGMAPNQLCDSQSDSVLYWWDEYNRDLVQYPGGQSVQPMKIAKNVSNLINHWDVEDPQLVYDNKYKEILFSAVCRVDNGDKKTLAYNEMIQQFTSVYNVDFQFAANVEDKTFLFKKDNNVCLWNEPGEKVFPLLKYVVNDKNTFTKVYDNVQIGMGESFYFDQFYNGETDTEKRDNQPLTFKFNTTEQNSQISKNITNREYDLRFAVPRNAESTMKYANNWGERMRGRTMQCELTSSSSSTGFSIQYIITKYRISWS